jgi:small redox-active disulfide protein 2
VSTKLQVLGSGCARCHALQANAEEAARRRGLVYEIEKVTDVNAIVAMGVMQTPALAIDGAVKVQGKVPGVEELEALLPAGNGSVPA